MSQAAEKLFSFAIAIFVKSFEILIFKSYRPAAEERERKKMEVLVILRRTTKIPLFAIVFFFIYLFTMIIEHRICLIAASY